MLLSFCAQKYFQEKFRENPSIVKICELQGGVKDFLDKSFNKLNSCHIINPGKASFKNSVFAISSIVNELLYGEPENDLTHWSDVVVYDAGKFVIRYLDLCQSSENENRTIEILYLQRDENKVYEFIEKNIVQFYNKKEELEGTINLLCFDRNFYIVKKAIGKFNVNLADNYGADFGKEYEVILERLYKKEGGLFLFHGVPGSGKTHLIKKIIEDLNELEILYLPPNLANNLADPSFIPFLLTEEIDILIIEDAEVVLRSRDHTGNLSGVSNLLNITDGILSDVFGIRVICTFNTERNKIDNALLRKGRLKYIHEFKNLSVKDSDNLLEKMGKKKQGKEMSLADIYNLEEDNKVVTKKRGGNKAI